MANNLVLLRSRRVVVVLALIALSVVAGKFGHPIVGMWDGPL